MLALGCLCFVLFLGQRQFESISIRIKDQLGTGKAFPEPCAKALCMGMWGTGEDSPTEKSGLGFILPACGGLDCVLYPLPSVSK